MGNKTLKRKSPNDSATKFSIGVKKRGNDGNTWEIVKTSTGVKRWKKINKTRKVIIIENDNIWGKNKKLEEYYNEDGEEEAPDGENLAPAGSPTIIVRGPTHAELSAVDDEDDPLGFLMYPE